MCGIAVSPQTIVPAAGDNPLSRGYRIRLDMRNHACDRLCLVDYTLKVHVVERRAEFFDMCVRVGESGQ